MRSDVQSLVDAFDPDIAIRPDIGLALPPRTVVVDYNLARLRAGDRTRAEFRETTAADGHARRILIEIPAFEPLEQLRTDLRVLAGAGNPDLACGLLVREKKRVDRLARMMEETFAAVQRKRHGPVTLVIGAGPRSIEGAPPAGEPSEHMLPAVAMTDPVTGREYRLATWPGLFSGDGLDPGTALLIDALPPLEGRRVLDVGCGCGPLTVAAAGRGARVTFADVDARALRMTSENLARYGLAGTALGTVDLSEPESGSFDVVVSNPPTHAGSDVLRALFSAMARVLSQDGRMLIVVREHLNYEKWLTALGSVEREKEGSGYKVLGLTASSSARRNHAKPQAEGAE